MASDPSTTPISFSEEFPKILDVMVIVDEVGHGRGGPAGRHEFAMDHIPEHCNCSSGCTDGGVSIAAVLFKMYHKRYISIRDELLCNGRDGNRNRCLNAFKITITVKYKST